MSRVLRAAVTVATVAALSLTAPLPAGACSCVVRNLNGQVDAASAVFMGSVRSTGDAGATFEIRTIYKGSLPNPIQVSGGDQASSCAVPFTTGRTYVVFAVSSGGTWSTDLCSGTTDDLSLASRLTSNAGLASPTTKAESPASPRKIAVVSRRAPI